MFEDTASLKLHSFEWRLSDKAAQVGVFLDEDRDMLIIFYLYGFKLWIQVKVMDELILIERRHMVKAWRVDSLAMSKYLKPEVFEEVDGLSLQSQQFLLAVIDAYLSGN